MILVVGATGVLGHEICRRLRVRGRKVRGLVRPGSAKEGALRELGVEIVHGDLRSPETLGPACDGIATVVATATAMGSKERTLTLRGVDRDGYLALVEVARLRGVRAFVYTSCSPLLQRSAPLVRYKREIERVVRTSGLRWTIVQPSAFMDVWFSSLLGWDHVTGRATIFGPGTAPVSWICVADVAEYAVRAIDDERVANVALPLGGPEALAPRDVVRIFEQVSGRPYHVRRVPRPILAALAPLVGIADEKAASGIALGAQTSRGDVIASPLQRELDLPLTTVRDFATRILHA
ncbi:MAG TPA: SDR family oxidoreductase [Gemmatimonadaceae bacterium]|nr:SDR family oxidoreductase [Gemmatimonadaceae bacterium]